MQKQQQEQFQASRGPQQCVLLLDPETREARIEFLAGTTHGIRWAQTTRNDAEDIEKRDREQKESALRAASGEELVNSRSKRRTARTSAAGSAAADASGSATTFEGAPASDEASSIQRQARATASEQLSARLAAVQELQARYRASHEKPVLRQRLRDKHKASKLRLFSRLAARRSMRLNAGKSVSSESESSTSDSFSSSDSASSTSEPSDTSSSD